MYKDEDGRYYTPEFDSVTGDTIERDVKFSEIQKLCKDGFGISLIDKGKTAKVQTTVDDNLDGTLVAQATASSASLPSSFSIIRRYGNVFGNLTVSGTRPSGTSTQWSAFNFTSYGYPKSEHVAFVHFVDAVLESQGNLVGNGFVIGNVSGHSSGEGCGGTNWPNTPVYNSEIESFWVGGNALWGATCAQNPNGLQEGVTYSFILHANTNEWVAYSRSGVPAPPAVYR